MIAIAAIPARALAKSSESARAGAAPAKSEMARLVALTAAINFLYMAKPLDLMDGIGDAQHSAATTQTGNIARLLSDSIAPEVPAILSSRWVCATNVL